MKMLTGPDSSMMYFILGVDFFSNSELVYPNMKVRLGVARRQSKFLHDY